MPDDVALHLARTGLDSISSSAQVGVRPQPFVDRVPIACQQLAVGTENFLGDLLQALVELAPEDFLDRAFGTRHAGCGDAAKGAHLVESHDFNLGAALCEFLADERVLRGGPAVARSRAREFDETRDVTLEDKMQARAIRAA